MLSVWIARTTRWAAVLPVALNRVLQPTSSDHPHLLLWSPNKIHLKTPDMIDPLTYTQSSASSGIPAGCYGVKRLFHWSPLVGNITWFYAAYDDSTGFGGKDR
jgi:hypothetical protein